ncbi:deoxyuridine 5'-triphosphate nucleotidohydrolase-like [Coffea arabica]|uniref:Deoxyuridine 5'-triphosphate nucleotidohydrolase n=1 Tax=Coffea arabica TaxID=13443 RepID=A0A6P6UR60_COFAR
MSRTIFLSIIPSPTTFSNFSTKRNPSYFQQIPRLINYPRQPPASFSMAQDMNHQNHSPEVKEPTPKIQKLDRENCSIQQAAPFFRVKRLSDNAILPSRGSPLSAGYDLSSAAETKVPARGKALIPTDLSIAVPQGTYARIAPRSGLTWKNSIDVGAGVIDADYRGPVGVILFNHSDVDFEVKPGDRIAQLIVQKIVTPEVEEVDDLDATVRGSGGFGSTGV